MADDGASDRSKDAFRDRQEQLIPVEPQVQEKHPSILYLSYLLATLPSDFSFSSQKVCYVTTEMI